MSELTGKHENPTDEKLQAASVQGPSADGASGTASAKKKQKWHFYVLLGILLLLIFLCVLSLGISSLKNYFSSLKPQKTDYSYVNTVHNLDLSKRPDTVSGIESGAFDYTIINDVLPKEASDVDQWLATYYPNGYTKKYKMENDVDWWVTTSSTPMPPISIDGITFEYDQVEVHFREGYAENVKFVKTQNATENDFFSTYYALEGKYGQQQMYTPQRNLIEKLMDPDNRYRSFSWTSGSFDGFYWLYLVRSEHTNEEENYIQFIVE